MAYINVVRTTDTSIKVNVSGLDSSYSYSDRVCTWYLNGRKKGTSNLPSKATSGGEYTFSGLSASTRYDIDVSIYVPHGDITVDLSTSEWTDDPSYDIYYGDVTSSSVEIIVSGLVRGDSVRVFLRLASETKAQEITKTSKGGSVSVTFTGLKSDTHYKYNASVNGTTILSNAYDVWTDVVKIEPWTWNGANTINGSYGEASSSQVISARNAIQNKGNLSSFSHKVWNDMVSKVIELQALIYYDWDSYYANAAQTKMSSSDTVLTARRFNSLRFNIDCMWTLSGGNTGIKEVKSQVDIVYGWYFTTLMSKVNQVINSI